MLSEQPETYPSDGQQMDNSHGFYAMFKQYIVHYGEALSISMVVIVALWSPLQYGGD